MSGLLRGSGGFFTHEKWGVSMGFPWDFREKWGFPWDFREKTEVLDDIPILK